MRSLQTAAARTGAVVPSLTDPLTALTELPASSASNPLIGAPTMAAVSGTRAGHLTSANVSSPQSLIVRITAYLVPVHSTDRKTRWV